MFIYTFSSVIPFKNATEALYSMVKCLGPVLLHLIYLL